MPSSIVHFGLDSGRDPVEVYDAVAPSFRILTAERRAYLDAVDRLVIARIPPGARTLLDAGAGDGRRSRLIAAAAGCTDLCLLEPSAQMRNAAESQTGYTPLRIEELHRVGGPFDGILCLWNVIGHVFPHAARVEAMAQFRRLLAPHGRLFLDVNHRYNAARYGYARTAGRYLHDRLRPAHENGDVVARWNLAGRAFSVRGHVFTAAEVESMAASASLRIESRIVVDYETGAVRMFTGQGNLLYVMTPLF